MIMIINNIIVAGYVLFLFVLACWHYYKFRQRLYYKRLTYNVQYVISQTILPFVGLEITNGEETPDNELNEEQLICKKTANRYGFKVKKLSRKNG